MYIYINNKSKYLPLHSIKIAGKEAIECPTTPTYIGWYNIFNLFLHSRIITKKRFINVPYSDNNYCVSEGLLLYQKNYPLKYYMGTTYDVLVALMVKAEYAEEVRAAIILGDINRQSPQLNPDHLALFIRPEFAKQHVFLFKMFSKNYLPIINQANIRTILVNDFSWLFNHRLEGATSQERQANSKKIIIDLLINLGIPYLEVSPVKKKELTFA